MSGMKPGPNHHPGGVPLIGQQQAAMRAQLMHAVGQLSLAIYTQLATAHVATRDEHQIVDVALLRTLAKDSETAAKAYFEGLGIAEFEK